VTEAEFGTPSTPTRSEIRRKSATDLSGLDEVFGNLFESMGITDISTIRPLDANEIDVLATELLAVRAAQDVITGRADALKKYATDVINLNIDREGEDSSSTSGYLYSTEHKVKLSKEVTGGKLNVDIDLLEKVLEPDQFHMITNRVVIEKTVSYPDGKTVTEVEDYRELNEDALERQLKLGNVGMEQIVKATLPSKTRTAFYVRAGK